MWRTGAANERSDHDRDAFDDCEHANSGSVTIGGKKADVLFAGLAPGFVGLAQVSVLAVGQFNLALPAMGAFTGMVLGVAIGSVRQRNPEGKVLDYFLCRPGGISLAAGGNG